mgnify:CR=1 FL=1
MLLNSARSAVDSIGQATQEVNMTAVTKLGTTMIATRGLARTFKTRGGKVEAVRDVEQRIARFPSTRRLAADHRFHVQIALARRRRPDG